MVNPREPRRSVRNQRGALGASGLRVVRDDVRVGIELAVGRGFELRPQVKACESLVERLATLGAPPRLGGGTEEVIGDHGVHDSGANALPVWSESTQLRAKATSAETSS